MPTSCSGRAPKKFRGLKWALARETSWKRLRRKRRPLPFLNRYPSSAAELILSIPQRTDCWSKETKRSRGSQSPSALEQKRTSKFSARRRPGAIDDLERVTKLSQEPQAPLDEGAIRDTVERFEATGSPVVTDGEQRKYHNFCTSACMASEDGPELGLVLGGPLIFN